MLLLLRRDMAMLRAARLFMRACRMRYARHFLRAASPCRLRVAVYDDAIYDILMMALRRYHATRYVAPPLRHAMMRV